MKITNKRIIKRFDKRIFNFSEIFLDYFRKLNIDNLEKLHDQLPKKYLPKKIIQPSNDQNQKIYDFIYKIDEGFSMKKKNPPSIFLKKYDKFISFLAKNIFKTDIVYQSRPTLRIMFPNNKAVGEFHRDRDYNHPIEEINIWLPITNAKNSNSIWIESSFDKKDFAPVNLEFGDFLIFDSGLKHGNKINLEKKTRLSFDFRIILYKDWKKMSLKKKKVTKDTKLLLKIGEYYKLKRIKT